MPRRGALWMVLSLGALLALPASAGAVATFADLSVTLSDSPDPVGAGGSVTYTMTVSNLGPQDANDVTLRQTLAAGMSTDSMHTTKPAGWGGPFDTPNYATFIDASPMVASTAATFTVTASPAPSGEFSSFAGVQAVSGPQDPDLRNNVATAVTNTPVAAPAMALTPATTTPTTKKKCKKRHAAVAKKKRCKKKD